MSIASKLSELATARDGIRTALADKGVSASSHGFNQFASDIASIPSGGSGVIEQWLTPQTGYSISFWRIESTSTSLLDFPSITPTIAGKGLFIANSAMTKKSFTMGSATTFRELTRRGENGILAIKIRRTTPFDMDNDATTANITYAVASQTDFTNELNAILQ